MTNSQILLIDDHAIMLEGLQILLKTGLSDARVVTAMSLHEALLGEDTPDVIVLDIKLPGINGLAGINRLQGKWPQAKVVMLSSQDDTDTQQQAFAHGAAAFVSKTQTASQITAVISAVLQGYTAPAPSPAIPVQAALTVRQYEVLDWLNQGLSNKLIAKKLTISDNTVRRHLQDIFAFFGVSSRTEAVFAARNRGIIR